MLTQTLSIVSKPSPFKKRAYHGSSYKLEVGTILRPNPNYEEIWGITDFYHCLEKHRPTDKPAHKDSVFVCNNDQDIDCAGGGTLWLFTVKPSHPISWHDLQWGSKISCLIGDGKSPDSQEVIEAAKNYWNGVATEDPLWEGLCQSAIIFHVEEY